MHLDLVFDRHGARGEETGRDARCHHGKCCRVNMMLICYPVAAHSSKIELRKEVFDSLRNTMTEMDIEKLLVATQWVRKSRNLTKFLDNVNNLEHKGWDYLIPLN
jgi:hypothetical protein